MVLLAIDLAILNIDNLTFPEGCLISEFLINYQGGFVRRGVVGELLFQFCKPLGINPIYVIVPVCVICALAFLYVLVRLFRKENLCLWILPTYYVCGGADYIRKDFIIMLFVLWLFRQIPKLLEGSRNTVPVILVMVLLLNIHEASFFIFYPVLCVYLLFAKFNKMPLRTRFAIIVAPVAMMLLLCVFKGSRECCEGIFNSWEYAYPNAYESMGSSDNAITALTWETLLAVNRHVNMNFFTGPLFKCSPLIIKPFVVALILYVMVQISFLHQRNSAEYWTKTRSFVFCALMQLIALLPMFTILSCDFRRICFYWTVSSFLTYFFLSGIPLTFGRIERINLPLRRLSEIIAKPLSPIYPFILLLLLGVPYTGNSIVNYMSPLGQKVFSNAIWHVSHRESDITNSKLQ